MKTYQTVSHPPAKYLINAEIYFFCWRGEGKGNKNSSVPVYCWLLMFSQICGS